MNDIAFSTDWFLTIPGMLITGGVILLIIALIMLIVSSSKGKKKAKAEQNLNQQASVAPGMGSPMMDSGMNMNAVPSVGDAFGVAPQESFVAPSSTPVMPSLDPVSPAMPEVASIPTVESITPTPSAPFTMDIPSVAPQTQENVSLDNNVVNGFGVSNVPETPVIAPEIPTISNDVAAPSIVPPIIEEVSQVPTTPVVPTETLTPTDSQVSNMNAFNELSSVHPVYGGTPVIPEVPLQEEPRPIYGGANPLEATQNLPKIDVHHEPYSGGTVAIETPVVDIPSVVPQPVVEPTPVVAPTPSVVMPTEVVTPVVSEVAVDTPVIPTVQPSVIPDVVPVQPQPAVGVVPTTPEVIPVVPEVPPVVPTPTVATPSVIPSTIDVEQL